jgi:hypothetical protein
MFVGRRLQLVVLFVILLHGVLLEVLVMALVGGRLSPIVVMLLVL